MALTLLINPLTGKLEPCFERDLVIHLCQERIKAARLLDHLIVDILRLRLLLGSFIHSFVVELLLEFLRDLENIILRPQFKNLHLPIQFHAAEFLSHASIKQFVEEDVSIVALDAHFQDMFFEVLGWYFAVETE